MKFSIYIDANHLFGQGDQQTMPLVSGQGATLLVPQNPKKQE